MLDPLSGLNLSINSALQFRDFLSLVPRWRLSKGSVERRSESRFLSSRESRDGSYQRSSFDTSFSAISSCPLLTIVEGNRVRATGHLSSRRAQRVLGSESRVRSDEKGPGGGQIR